MINRIFSSLAFFKDLELQPGLNVLLADKNPGASDRQTRNRAGKTSLIEVISFAFGSNCDARSIFRNSAIVDATFGVEFSCTGRRIIAERSGSVPGKVRVDSSSFDDWPLQPIMDRKTKQPTISNNQWRAVLGALLFRLPAEEEDDESNVAAPSFRSLFAYFVRRQNAGAFVQPTKQAEMQQVGDQQIAISYLLGLDWTIPQQWEEIRRREKSLKELRRAASDGVFGRVIGKSADLRTELALAEEAARRLRSSLRQFRVIPEYQSLEKEASRLTAHIADLSNKNTADWQLIGDLERSLTSEHAPGLEDVRRVYEEAGIVLPELVTRRFDDVRAFHESVVRNRRMYLEAEVQAARERVARRDTEKDDLDERRSRIMDLLRSGGALEHFSQLQSELTQQEAAAEAIRQRFLAAQQLESEKTLLDIERARLLTRLREDYAEQEGTLTKAILAFEEVSEALYETAGRLTIEPTPNGPEFKIEIQGASSKGISNMQIYCFDMMLMRICSERGIGPGFLVHDSHLFDGVDSRQVARALRVGAEMADNYGFQYLVTMNSDAVPPAFPDGFDFNRHVLPKRLTDEEETGGLFGVRFG